MAIFLFLSRLQIIHILIIGGAIIGVYYFALFDDGSQIKSETEGVKQSLQAERANISKKTENLKEVKIFEKEGSYNRKLFKEFIALTPADLNTSEVSALLLNEAKNFGLNVTNKEYMMDQASEASSEEGKKVQHYTTIKIKLTLQGDFSQILSFLAQLTGQKRVLVVESIDMKRNQESKLVESSIEVLAYRYNPDSEKVEKEKKEGEESPAEGEEPAPEGE